MRQSFQFKLFRCKRLRHLHRTIDVAAEIWNHAIALHRRYYRLFKKTLPKAKLQAHLAKLRNAKMSYWQVVGSQSVQAITDRLYLAWEAFFRRDIKRPPTFRKRRKYRSFTLKQAGYKVVGHGRIRILGRNYRFNQSRALSGVIKTVTLRRDALDDIYVTFSCDQVQQPELAPKTGLSAGADFGLKDFLTLSIGERITAPQPLKAHLRRLRKAQRRLSRKQKGSMARSRARLDVARVHRKVGNVRNDWQWNQARMLLLTFDLVAFETLNLRGMQQLWGPEGWVIWVLAISCTKPGGWPGSWGGICSDRPVGTQHKNLSPVRAPAGYAAQHANIRLRVLRPCRTPGRERVSQYFGGGAPSPVGSVK